MYCWGKKTTNAQQTKDVRCPNLKQKLYEKKGD